MSRASLWWAHTGPVCLVQEAMEHPQAELYLWEVVSLPPGNSSWIDKCECELSTGQRSCFIKKMLCFNPRQQPSPMQPLTPLRVGYEGEKQKSKS